MDIWTRLARCSVIELDTLWLRPFAMKDSHDFWEIASKQTNTTFIFPPQVNRQESDFLMVHYFMKEPLGVWAIEEKSTGKMIGSIRLENLRLVEASAEIGYFLHQDYWGKGLMTACLKTVADFAFREVGLSSLHLLTHQENRASQRVAEKVGFQLKRQFKGSDRYTRKMRDYRDYLMTREVFNHE
ncbi:GNAT family N-acetyltransferase [Streptococcus sp. HF-1907]|uniref:GNAT family N-acetyltransferase n=1 Tax=Streptococcus sp. HF-1907 TaxID=2785793 RepID=UPI00189F2ED5|nr:GNAT family N-acetyltransferase [Streptococcus sp. HF-1907]MBF7093915.1 GNAT family N-acetyltransferase [Streptococcus sp. HF-1907]